MVRCVTLAGALCALAVLAPSSSSRTQAPAAPRLEALFAEAQRDPAGVVPLLVEGSRVLASLPPEAARRLGDTLEPFARRTFFGPERLPGMERLGLVLHTVAKGENPTVIAARYDVGSGLLGYLNESFEPKKLRVGQRLKVLDASHGELELSIDRATFRLTAWRQLAQGGRVLVLFAPVGLGAADSPTPTGQTRITTRVLEPQWTDPDTRQVFGPKDPRNVLGGYWIALDPDGLGGRRGIGLHGYTGSPADDWLEKPGSQGCIRLLQKDVDRVFHLATEGTVVEIR
ncbi:MAG: L,D-transpeptidase family protein [Planctomycetes bacterium]|nr:L,D-transpeptidase family protein [Planctomycetota bacterium]